MGTRSGLTQLFDNNGESMISSEKGVPEAASIGEICKTISAEKTIFFVGSGVSCPYPSSLPSAKEMLRIVLNAAAPLDGEEKELNQILKLSTPELYYEALVEIAGPKAAWIWSLLTIDKRVPELKSFALGPDLGHLAIVYFSWRHSLPVITTNYDLRLEQAADRLDLKPVVCHSESPHGYRRAKGPEEVAVWKVRGSADNPSSISSTLYEVTRFDEVLITELRHLFEHHRSCLIGYSGRDFDLFPSLVEFKFPEKAYWVDLKFLDEERHQHLVYHFPEKFKVLELDSTSLGRHLIGHIDKLDPRRKVLEREAWRLSEIEKQVRAERITRLFQQIGEQFASQLFEEILTQTSPDRLLNHALSLASIGNNERALHYIDEFLDHDPDPPKVCRALIIKAYSLRELSCFVDSEYAAKAAFQLAKKQKLRAEQASARAAIDSALYMKHLLPLGFRDNRHLWRWRSWTVVARMLLDCVLIPFMWVSTPRARSSPAQLRARWNYLGHLIRTSSVTSRLASRFSRPLRMSPLLYGLLAWWWRHLELKCKKAGYPVGIATVRRYMERLPSKYRKKGLPPSSLYSLMVARSERALVAYDEATALFKAGRREEAIQRFWEGIYRAKEVNDKVVALRGIVSLRQCGEKTGLRNLQEIGIQEIQSEALIEIREDLIRWLTNE